MYTKLQALKLLDDKKLSPYANIEVHQIIKNMFLLDGFIIQTDLASGHFYCLRPNLTRAARVAELESLDGMKNPGNAPDIQWLLKLNQFKPVTFKHSIAEIKKSEFEYMLEGGSRIETDEGSNVNCGCQVGTDDEIKLADESPDKFETQAQGFSISKPETRTLNSTSRQLVQERNSAVQQQKTKERNSFQPKSFMLNQPRMTVNLQKNQNQRTQLDQNHYRAQSQLGSTAMLNHSMISKQSALNDSYIGTQRSSTHNNGRGDKRYSTRTNQGHGSTTNKSTVNQSFQENTSIILPKINSKDTQNYRHSSIRISSVHNSLNSISIQDPENTKSNRIQTSAYQNNQDSLLMNQSQYDSQSMFQKSKGHNKTLMYNRAMNKLKILLNHKGLQESALDNSSYGLFHFHIEAMDNNISLNKFESNPNQYSSYTNQSFDQHKKFNLINVEDQSREIDLNPINQKQSTDKGKIRRQETEDFISDDLIKNSPVYRNIQRKRTIRNEQFMMQVRPTNHIGEESVNGDFSAREQAVKQAQQPQRTILFIKEVDDNEKDFLKMEIKEFVNLSSEELQQAYNRLMKAVIPVFSGAIDTLINKLDLKKLKDNANPYSYLYKINPQIKDQSSLNEIEQSLVEQLKTCRSSLEDQDMLYGQWSILTQQGSIPDSREGSTACMIDNNLYLFGGFSRDLFRDVRVFDIQTQRWRLIMPNKGNMPHARFAHSMCQYDNKIYIFGGAGPYISSIKMRLSFNDVQVFDIDQEQWLKEPDIEGAPKKRQNHIGCMLGSAMVVHGGFNTEQKKVLNDFGIFDVDIQKWVNTRVYIESERIDDKHFPYDETHEYNLGFRHMHSATVVIDSEYHEENQSQSKFKDKHLWLYKREFSREQTREAKNFDEGIYIFGGCNQHGHVQNDMWIIEPYYNENKKFLNHQTYEYMTKPTLSVNLRKINDFKGKPPCPRISHATVLFKDWNNHNIIVIYGGRNDGIFAKTQNVAMNDICLFNVNLKEWQPLAMYGQMPCSRWSHVLTMNGNSRGDGFIVFGGVNLKNYCKSRLYQFEIWNSWYKPQKVNDEKLVNEKFEMLNNNVKEKIDIIKDIMNKPKK
eukprot:403331578